MELEEDKVVINGYDLTKDVFDALRNSHRKELAQAELEQKKLMEAEARVSNGERKDLSFGRLRMKVCPEVYHFWGGKLGYECWRDGEFISWLEKKFSDLVSIKSRSARVGV